MQVAQLTLRTLWRSKKLCEWKLNTLKKTAQLAVNMAPAVGIFIHVCLMYLEAPESLVTASPV